MKKINKSKMIMKQDLINIAILLIGMFILLLIVLPNNSFYGANMDWLTQHTVLPEYMRKEFYATGELIPQFSSELGAGQNIFNISYYGLLNPFILISYALPFIPMYIYIAGMGIACVIAAVILFYIWLRKNNFTSMVTLIATIFFALSSPLMFHSHRHIMFITYMPFLILALIGVNSFFKLKKKLLLSISIMLMFLTSYYYSVSGIFVIIIYAVNYYLKEVVKITGEKFRFKTFIKDGLNFILRVLLGIMMSAVLLIPTLMTLVNRSSVGGGTGERPKEIVEMLVPKINIDSLLYSSYGVGLVAIVIISIVTLYFLKNKHDLVLAIILSLTVISPIVSYILNGGLYASSKALIPFLPLYCLVIAIFLNAMYLRGFKTKSWFCVICLVGVVLYFFGETKNQQEFALDYACAVIAIVIFLKWNFKMVLPLTSIVAAITVCIGANIDENYAKLDKIDMLYDEDKRAVIEQVIDENASDNYRWDELQNTKDTVNFIYNTDFRRATIYSSVYATNYNKLFYDVFNNPNAAANRVNCNGGNNIFFYTLMGVKNVVSTSEAPIGYNKVKTVGEYSVYENENVYSIGFANSRLMSKREFSGLNSIQQSLALLKYIIVDKDIPDVHIDDLKSVDIELPLEKTDKTNDYIVNSDENIEFLLDMPLSYSKNIYIIDMMFSQMYKKSVVIEVNGIKEVLSSPKDPYPNGNYDFSFVLSSNIETQKTKFLLSAGNYIIHDLKMLSIDYDVLKNYKTEIDELVVKSYEGNMLEGNIEVSKDGYFVLTIPYAKGFTLFVDGKETEIEELDTCFIGCDISKGNHTIKLVYNTPGLLAGKIITIANCILFAAMCLFTCLRDRGTRNGKNERIIEENK